MSSKGCKVDFLKQGEGYTEDLTFYYTAKCWQLYSGCCSVNGLKATNKDCNSTFVRAYIVQRKNQIRKQRRERWKNPADLMSIFQRALGCICTVFRSCDCSTSRSHLNPARSGKKSHKSLRVNSNCHVWWKRWTSMFQDFYQMYPMRLDDLCVLPLPESVLNSHNLQKCSGPRFQTLGVSMIFLIVEWTNSYLNNCFVSPKHVASCTENGCGDRRSVLSVLLLTTQRKIGVSSECELEQILQRETHRKNH